VYVELPEKISKSERLHAFAYFMIVSRIVGATGNADYMIWAQGMDKPQFMNVFCITAASICYVFLDLLLQYFNRRFDVIFHGSFHFSVLFIDF